MPEPDTLDRLADDLAAKVTPPPPEGTPPNTVRRWGQIVAIGTGGCDVELSDSGTTIPNVARLGRYRPKLGQRVLVDVTSDAPVIIDYVETASSVEAPHMVGASGEPAFTNGWVNYLGTPPYASACFWKDPEGFVWLCGMVKNGTGSVFTLPVGYRPALSHDFGTIANGSWNELGVHADGTVVPSGSALPWLSLSGLSFPTDVSRFHWVGAPGEPAFQNGWTNYGSTFQILIDGVMRSAGYYLDANGFVHLTGLVKSGTMATAIFTLPPGYRPPVQWLHRGLATGAAGRIDIDPYTGTVTPHMGTNGYQSLDGIVFPTDMSAWHPLRPVRTAAGFWESFSDDSTWATPGYFVDEYEIAHFSGLMAGGVANSDLGIPGPGLLPRSALHEIFASISNNTAARIDTFNAGVPVAQTPISSAWASLHSVMLRVNKPGG